MSFSETKGAVRLFYSTLCFLCIIDLAQAQQSVCLAQAGEGIGEEPGVGVTVIIAAQSVLPGQPVPAEKPEICP